MTTDIGQLDLFCRVNVQSEMPHGDFVAFIARCVGGASRMNSITTGTLDISVDDNDVFDEGRSRTGKDRWLYFRYTLEIDPAGGVAPRVYLAAIAALLQAPWSSGMDAVASSDFEHQLPENPRRFTWATTSGSRDENAIAEAGAGRTHDPAQLPDDVG